MVCCICVIILQTELPLSSLLCGRIYTRGKTIARPNKMDRSAADRSCIFLLPQLLLSTRAAHVRTFPSFPSWSPTLVENKEGREKPIVRSMTGLTTGTPSGESYAWRKSPTTIMNQLKSYTLLVNDSLYHKIHLILSVAMHNLKY